MKTNEFGKKLARERSYAYGDIIRSPLQEYLKLEHSGRIIKERVARLGADGIFNFTAETRVYPLKDDDIRLLDGWAGVSTFIDELRDLAREHLGGDSSHEVAFFNRVTTGVVSAVCALVNAGGVVLSAVPGYKSHPCAMKAADLAGARFVEVSSQDAKDVERAAGKIGKDLSMMIVCPSVKPQVFYASDGAFQSVINVGKRRGVPVLIDDASGATHRTVLLNQSPALKLGADLVITSSDKRGKYGPRGGILVGDRQLVRKVAAEAEQIGAEADSAKLLGIFRCLQRWDPEALRSEQRIGEEIRKEVAGRLGQDALALSSLGVIIPMENILELISARAGRNPADTGLVPVEASCLVAMILLEDDGIMTHASIGSPGATLSLRIKPSAEEAKRFGGPAAIAEAVDRALDKAAGAVQERARVSLALFGVAPEHAG